MYRLKMSEYCLLIVCLVCKFIKITDCSAEKNSTSWSAINLVVDSRDYKNGFASAVPTTTKTAGIVVRSEEAIGGGAVLWTKIDVTERPRRTKSTSKPEGKYRATLRKATTIAFANRQNSTSSPEESNATAVSSNRSLETTNSSTEMPRKGINGETGHAFFYDDDDDDDDEYDDDDDEEYNDEDYPKKDKEEVEEVEEPDQNVEEQAETADTEAQEEYGENYAETRPPIILRTRRKNKRKNGKKHTHHVKIKDFKKLRKFMLPLLLAYKLKFFTLVPLLLGGLVLIVATTGFAGFFFALFAVGLGLKHHH